MCVNGNEEVIEGSRVTRVMGLQDTCKGVRTHALERGQAIPLMDSC